ncbi:signal peptidase I [Sphaerisporangium sp. NPDC005289]|uniref:signal peptidase I n=1 Tax=Sphaerisporangium sp. NPDC005289 TaxID=3155247 RepID=UPI0033BA087E
MTRLHPVWPPLLLVAGPSTGCGLVPGLTGHHVYDVTSEAMLPTLKVGTTVTAKTVDGYAPKMGDVVAVRTPDNWSFGGGVVLTRVIGVPGSTLRCCDDDGRVQLNGKFLDEPYIARSSGYRSFGPVTVPPGRIWTMGDNRDASIDSRSFQRSLGDGTIPAENVVAIISSN